MAEALCTKCYTPGRCSEAGRCLLVQKQAIEIEPTTFDPIAVRGRTHGDFGDNAEVGLGIRNLIRSANNWQRLSKRQQLALEEIALKIARITTGDPKFRDSWLDLVGYSKLGMTDCND